MSCPRCGHMLAPNANFCASCGLPVAAMAAMRQTSAVNPVRQPAQSLPPTVVGLSLAPTPPPPQPAPFPMPVILPGHRYADLGQRVAAWLLDSLVNTLLFGCAYTLAMGGALVGAAEGELLLVLITLAAAAYWIVPTALSGQTLGKRAVGVRVVNKHGGPPGFVRSSVRFLGMMLESALATFLIGLIGLLNPLWDRDKQTWHDKLAGTYVVDA